MLNIPMANFQALAALGVVVCFIEIDVSLLQLDTDWLHYQKAFQHRNLGDDKFKIGYCM